MNDSNTQPADHAFNEEAWGLQYRTIYERYSDTDNVISVTSKKDGEKGLRVHGFARPDDEAAVTALVRKAATADRDAYISISTLDPALSSQTRSRGTKADSKEILALIVDLDCTDDGAVHAAGDRNPTKAQALGWVRAFPIEPTLVTDTGGGLHAWWNIDGLDAQDPATETLLKRWKLYWLAVGSAVGKAVDPTPLADPARVLRIAGSTNAKQGGRPVTVLSTNCMSFVSVELLEDVLPQLPARAAAPTRDRRPQDGATGAATADTQASAGERPGDAFDVQVPVSAFVERVLGASLYEESPVSVHLPRPDGRFGEKADGKLANDYDGKQSLLVFSGSAREALGMTESQPWTSYEMIRKGLFDGDFKTATKFIATWRENDGSWGDAFFDALARILPERVTARFGLAAPTGDPLPKPVRPSAEVATPNTDGSYDTMTGEARTLTIADALGDGPRIPAQFEIGGGITIKVGYGKDHGLFKTVTIKDEAGGERDCLVRVVDFVAWHSEKVEHKSVYPNGEPYEIAPPEFTVQIATAAGLTKSKAGFGAKEATKILDVLDELDSGSMMPEFANDDRKVVNMLRNLGKNDAQKVISEMHTEGWMKDENGTHVFLAPAGSVNAAGAAGDQYVVSGPPKSEDGALTESAMEVGYPVVPTTHAEIREAASALGAYFRIFPNSMHIAASTLGLQFATPLALRRRCSIGLLGNPGSGKTIVLSAAQAWNTGVVFKDSFTGGSINKDTPTAASIKMSYGRNTVLAWDDYAMGNDESANRRIKEVIGNVLKAAYGEDGQGAGLQNGGLRAGRVAKSSAIFTAEGSPTMPGIVSRYIPINFVKGESAALSPAGSSPYDEFRNYADRARQLYGSYLSWLAARIDKTGLRAFSSENDTRAREWEYMATGGDESNRTYELVAVLGVGWTVFREFADKVGISDLLPSEDDVNKTLIGLVAVGMEFNEEASLALTVINYLRDQIASGHGHLTFTDDSSPDDAIAGTLGWSKRQVTNSMGIGSIWAPSFNHVGILSKDQTQVVLLLSAINTAKNACGLNAVSKDQLKNSARKYVVEGTEPNEQTSRALGHKRGWVIPVSALDIDLTPVLETQPAFSPLPIELAEMEDVAFD